MTNFIKGIKNFFHIVFVNWIGALIGFVFGLIFSLILDFTAFKNNKVLATIFSIIFMIVFTFAGMFIQQSIFPKSVISGNIAPTEVSQELNVNLIKGWRNTNGGFSFSQILTSQEDTNCPIKEDQIFDLNVQDFGEFVCFSFKKDEQKYRNIVFLKTDNGLILDGMLNMTCSIKDATSKWSSWFSFGLVGRMYDLQSFEWQSYDGLPYYFTNVRRNNIGIPQAGQNYDDLVSLSKTIAGKDNNGAILYNNPSFSLEAYSFSYDNASDAKRLTWQKAIELTSQNTTDNFIKFGEIELVKQDNGISATINSFYNYLYNEVKSLKYEEGKLVNCVGLTCIPIPKDLQKNYPIPASEKTNYATDPTDLTTAPDYYGVYRTNIAFNCMFLEGNKNMTSSGKQTYIETIEKESKDTDKITVVKEVPNIISKAAVSKLHINFKNTKDNAITNINLKQNPIKIQFNCEELNLSKIVEINSFEKLEKGIDCIFNKNVTWKYQIDSSELIFENFIGSFKLEDNSNDVCFDYYYLENFVVANVGLNPVKTIDESTIDLSANPVKIILSNSKHTYQFVFDSNDKLNAYESMVIEVGEYEYTILSKQLIFASVSGKLTITTTDRTMLFNYALNLDKNDLDFTINISNSSGTTGRFELYSALSNVDLIRNELGGDKVYKVNCYIYDNAGKLMETFSHTHYNSGTCGDTWTTQNLTIGQTYTMQLRFTDSSDTTKTYLSDISDFVYNSSVTYKITYNVTKV